MSLVVVIHVGCSGGNSEPSGAYKAADVERLASLAPRTPGWPPWPQTPEPKQSSGVSAEEAAAKDPIFAEYRRKTEGIEEHDAWGSGNKWADADKLANLVVGISADAADAHVAFLAANDLSRAYAAKFGFVAKAEKVDGLGDEAWRLWSHWNGRQVTYHWRRDNLGVEVHLHCYGVCGPDTDADVDAAARAWADAIDEEARSAGG